MKKENSILSFLFLNDNSGLDIDSRFDEMNIMDWHDFIYILTTTKKLNTVFDTYERYEEDRKKLKSLIIKGLKLNKAIYVHFDGNGDTDIIVTAFPDIFDNLLSMIPGDYFKRVYDTGAFDEI